MSLNGSNVRTCCVMCFARSANIVEVDCFRKRRFQLLRTKRSANALNAIHNSATVLVQCGRIWSSSDSLFRSQSKPDAVVTSPRHQNAKCAITCHNGHSSIRSEVELLIFKGKTEMKFLCN